MSINFKRTKKMKWIKLVKSTQMKIMMNSWKKSSQLSGWATEMYFSKVRARIFLIILSWALVMTFQISVAVLCAMVVVSRYCLTARSAWSKLSRCKKIPCQQIQSAWKFRRLEDGEVGMHYAYLVKEFNEDIRGEVVPSRATLFCSLVGFVISQGDEILEC